MSHNTGEDKTGGEKGIRVSVRNTAREAKDRNVRCKLNEIGKRSLKGLRENEGMGRNSKENQHMPNWRSLKQSKQCSAASILKYNSNHFLK